MIFLIQWLVTVLIILSVFNPAVSDHRHHPTPRLATVLTLLSGESRTCFDWRHRLDPIHRRCHRSNSRCYRSSWHRLESLSG